MFFFIGLKRVRGFDGGITLYPSISIITVTGCVTELLDDPRIVRSYSSCYYYQVTVCLLYSSSIFLINVTVIQSFLVSVSQFLGPFSSHSFPSLDLIA